MRSMFDGCSGLTALDVSGFHTANVTNMWGMFHRCSGLAALDVSGFHTANVTDMGWMFRDCAGLTALDVSAFDTANVTDMEVLFSGCLNLKTICASERFATEQLGWLGSRDIFWDCSSLVGGNGTVWSAEHIVKDYAHIDGGPSNPGYFTAKT